MLVLFAVVSYFRAGGRLEEEVAGKCAPPADNTEKGARQPGVLSENRL